MIRHKDHELECGHTVRTRGPKPKVCPKCAQTRLSLQQAVARRRDEEVALYRAISEFREWCPISLRRPCDIQELARRLLAADVGSAEFLDKLFEAIGGPL